MRKLLILLIFIFLMNPVRAGIFESSGGGGNATEISSLNASSVPLSGGATFTGTGEQNNLPQVMTIVQTDATGTCYFDFSVDGTNWSAYPSNGFKVASGINEFHTAVKGPRYFRVRYVNDSVAQTYLRLHTYYGSDFVPSVAPLNQTASLDQDAIFTRATNSQDEITLGRRTGVISWGKFGYNADVDSATPEVVSGFGGSFVPMTTAQTFTITYDGTSGGSTDGAGTNGAHAIAFSYIDANGNPATATHTLETDGSDVTSFTGLGINRLKVISAGSDEVNANIITVTATSSGTNQAQIPAGDGITQQAIFFNGANHKSVLHRISLNARKLSGGTAPRVTFRAWVYNRTDGVLFQAFRWDIDTSIENSIQLTDLHGLLLSEYQNI